MDFSPFSLLFLVWHLTYHYLFYVFFRQSFLSPRHAHKHKQSSKAEQKQLLIHPCLVKIKPTTQKRIYGNIPFLSFSSHHLWLKIQQS